MPVARRHPAPRPRRSAPAAVPYRPTRPQRPAPTASAAARRAASPRRVNGGGSASSTVAPASTSCAPGSRSTARSPATSGSAAGRPRGRAGRGRSPSGRTRTGADAVPTWRVRAAASGDEAVQHDVDAPWSAQAARGRAARCRGGRPRSARARRFTATRVGPGRRPRPGLVVHLQAAHPHRLAAEQRGCRRGRTDPVGRVPVTTVPAPVTVNDRSTQSRTGAAGSPAGCGLGQDGQRGAGVVEPGAGARRRRRAATGRMPCRASRARASASRRARGRRGRPW